MGKNSIFSLFVMHYSKLSTLPNPLTKLTHIASFYLCEPPKNNGLSNCSLLTLLSTHFVNSCSSAVLFYDADQNWSVSTGKDWSKPEIIVSMPSPVVLRLSSLALMLFSLYTSKTVSTWLHDLKRKLNVLQKLMKKSLYVWLFFWHLSSICHEINNHVSMMICWRQVRWNIICYHLSSVVIWELFGFWIKPFFVRQKHVGL